MQEGILQIGRAVYDSDNFLNNIIKDVQIKDRKGKPRYVIQIDFSIEKDKIDIKLFGEVTKDSSHDLLWIGTADGSSSPQWYTTGNKTEYLLSQTIPNLINLNIPNISNKLRYILNNFFWDFGKQKGTKERYRYVVDLKKISNELKAKDEIAKDADNDIKKIVKVIDKEVANYIKSNLGITNKEVALYFITIDNRKISDMEEYRQKIKEEKLKVYEKSETGSCSLCGGQEGLTSDTSKLKLKFYTTTNLNFPSQFLKSNYNKNMVICKDCMIQLMAGEQYIIDNLSTYLGNMQVYLIPHFLYTPEIDKGDMDYISKDLTNTFNTAKKVQGIIKFESEILNTFEDYCEENYYLLNILFYKIVQKAVKVQKLIKDVQPSRFRILIEEASKVQESFKSLISDKFNTHFGLESIYYSIPIKVKQGEVKEYRKLLNIYNAIFKRLRINKKLIIKSQIDLFKVHYFEKHNQYNVRPAAIHFAIMQSNMLIKFLENIGCLEEGSAMELNSLNIDDGIKEYIKEMKYSEKETVLFLLGLLVGKVGNRQYSDRNGKKPILNKLNFNGMDLAKVKRLSSEIVNKLRQNKILSYNEKIYSAHKQLFDKHIKNWDLDKYDNLYYILSGYSYATMKSISKERGNKNE
ncbi:TIGR02556 family CRISPR-associated protein [Paramaledivibacter caminithermalis]|uniref:CRISPR-associated protein Csh1 n=1 Tax=Paramaledivibacter caminithermalis (strain DSM 15212 / CIP 107654 / DViRD3) TaxID=1121301 RepID=A0A1M6KP90_PARC5|nr:TIGR02556 family CRISPR-associated protein [Paramaledivibacter caminithermalis]SHJ60818.1 CRISPR-associated protein Csh1 [Paramaledivibacter caminithermalis DSM 15212]